MADGAEYHNPAAVEAASRAASRTEPLYQAGIALCLLGCALIVNPEGALPGVVPWFVGALLMIRWRP